MPSSITRDDLRDELYGAGIRSPAVLARLMTVIEGYALTQVRKVRPLEDTPIPPDPEFSGLLPGESDMEKKVTRCRQCGYVKRWELFRESKSSVTGRKITCKACARSPRPVISYEDRRWYCPSCKKKKPPAEFPQEKKDSPRIRVARCLPCGGML